jgi:RNA polymerase sigma factor (sigma-70 family)
MTSGATDQELLARYVRQRDHDAFAQIVQRYLALVRSAASRQTRDPALADDVTQAVMIVLARRGRQIPRGVSLASWLFTVTHHISRNALRGRARRAIHEQAAASQRLVDGSSPSQIEPDLRELLDEAIIRLPHLERGGVVLHYLNQCSHQQVGEALGLSAEAARKRVSRGVERLRAQLVGRGIAVSCGMIASTMKSEALAATGAPVAAAEAVRSTVSVALLCASDAPPVNGIAGAILAQGAPAIHSIATWKLAASIALLAAGLATAAGAASAFFSATDPASSVPTTAPVVSPAVSDSSAQVTPDIRIDFLGSSSFPGDDTTWFDITGEKIEMPDAHLADNSVNTDTRPDRQVALRLHAPKKVKFNLNMEGSSTFSDSDDDIAENERLLRCRFLMEQPDPKAINMSISISTGDWRNIAVCEDVKDVRDLDAGTLGTLNVSPPVHDARWGTQVHVRRSGNNVLLRALAVDEKGAQHEHSLLNNDYDGDDLLSAFSFDLAPESIKSVIFQVREFDKLIEIKGISPAAGAKTQPSMTVRDLKEKK